MHTLAHMQKVVMRAPVIPRRANRGITDVINRKPTPEQIKSLNAPIVPETPAPKEAAPSQALSAEGTSNGTEESTPTATQVMPI